MLGGAHFSFDSHSIPVKRYHHPQCAVEEMQLREVEPLAQDHTALVHQDSWPAPVAPLKTLGRRQVGEEGGCTRGNLQALS